jgi:hypothetical protein
MTTPAGWYPDPSGAPAQRYFDGVSWTDHQVATPRRRVWPWIVPVVLVLFVGVCAAVLVVGDHLGSWSSLTHHGATARDGHVQFELVHFGPAELQNDPRPTGEYFLARCAVTNAGGDPLSFAASDQKLVDAAGREYPAMHMVDQASPRHETDVLTVGPGVTVKVIMRFEGPKHTELMAIEVHESSSSTGARVSLH